MAAEEVGLWRFPDLSSCSVKVRFGATVTRTILAEMGAKQPHPPFTHSSDVSESRHGISCVSRAVDGHFGCFNAFDPRRTAILLIGGDKR